MLTVLGDASWVAQSTTIARNPKVTGLYSCTEVDLTGQVCCDSIGTCARMYSGKMPSGSCFVCVLGSFPSLL